MISFAKCFTGRRWINIGSGLLAVGVKGFSARIMWRGKFIYPKTPEWIKA
jgi:hypothetical protein